MIWHYWVYWLACWLTILGPVLVVEKKGSGPGGVNLYQSYGQSSCMNATVTVALEQARSPSTPNTAGDDNLVACA